MSRTPIACAPASSVSIAQVATTDISVRLLLAPQIRALQGHGFDVRAVCAPGAGVAEARAMGLDVDEVAMEREIAPVQDLMSLIGLTRYFRHRGYTVVNTHTPKAGILGPLAARIARVPIVIHTVHGLLFHDQMPLTRQAFFFLTEFFTARSAHYLFFQSQEDLERAAGFRFLPRDRLFYIGNGINLDRFAADRARSREDVRSELRYAPDDYVVGLVARLTYEKGLKELFEAARMLIARDPKIHFLFVGPVEPDQNDRVRPEDVATMEATGRARFLGMRRDVADLYQAMDTFVLPSWREGIPRALMEASAMARPVIATDIRGCREVVKDRETGLLIPVRTPSAIVRAIEELRDQPEAAHRYALAGQQRIRTVFDENIVHGRILGAFTEICARHGLGLRPVNGAAGPEAPCATSPGG